MATKNEPIKVISCFPLINGEDEFQEIVIPVKRIKKYSLLRHQSADCDVFGVGIWYGGEYTIFLDAEYCVESIVAQLKDADW